MLFSLAKSKFFGKVMETRQTSTLLVGLSLLFRYGTCFCKKKRSPSAYGLGFLVDGSVVYGFHLFSSGLWLLENIWNSSTECLAHPTNKIKKNG